MCAEKLELGPSVEHAEVGDMDLGEQRAQQRVYVPGIGTKWEVSVPSSMSPGDWGVDISVHTSPSQQLHT